MTRNLVRKGQIYLYGPVGGSFWDDSGFTDEDVIAALEMVSGDVTVRLNSPGGSVFQGIAIHSLLSSHEGKVTIMIDALAASAASVIACAGDTVIMAPGAQFMVHDPSDITWGDADDHRRAAAALDSIARSAANIYAMKSGKAVDDCLAMMSVETWLGADDAIAAGFADRTTGAEEATADPAALMSASGFPSFDYSIFHRAPTTVMAASVSLDFTARKQRMSVPPANPAALPASPKEPSMTKPNELEPVTAPNANPLAVTMSVDDFIAMADKHGLSAKEMSAVKKKAKPASSDIDVIDPVLARDAVLDILASRQPEPSIHHPAVVTEDAREKFVKGASLSLLAKGGKKGEGERNEFSGMSLLRLAEESITMAGGKVPTSREQIARVALGTGARMAHTTSDFPLILEDVARKSLLKGHDETEETFSTWTSTGSLSDFKESSRVDLSTLPALEKVVEDGEYKDVSLGERQEKIRLAKYGNIVSITWEMIVGDDLDAFTRMPRLMGRAARRTVGDVVYGVLTGNPAMSDGVALFHATHKNLTSGGGSALSQAALSALRTKMRTQKDGESSLNIRPRFLLVPAALEDTANVLMASEFSPGETQRVPNSVRNMATVVSESRLDDASATAFYLAADPSSYDTIEVAYLDGRSEPEMFEEDGFRKDGIQYKVRHVFGVAPLSWRTLAKSAGA